MGWEAKMLWVLRVFVLGVFAAAGVAAQPAGRLYDPEPPLDSAYLRVLVLSEGSPVGITVDGKTRLSALPGNRVSDYLVVAAGTHVLALKPESQGKDGPVLTVPTPAGKAMTVVFTGTKAASGSIVFTDKTSTNRLKAMLSVYQLANTSPAALDVVTLDGKTKVFSSLNYSDMAALAVNPVNADLKFVWADKKLPEQKVRLNLVQGAAYSMFVLPTSSGTVRVQMFENKIEKYTK